MNKASLFYQRGIALCDECDRHVEPERVARAKGLGPFLCQACADETARFFADFARGPRA